MGAYAPNQADLVPAACGAGSTCCGLSAVDHKRLQLKRSGNQLCSHGHRHAMPLPTAEQALSAVSQAEAALDEAARVVKVRCWGMLHWEQGASVGRAAPMGMARTACPSPRGRSPSCTGASSPWSSWRVRSWLCLLVEVHGLPATGVLPGQPRCCHTVAPAGRHAVDQAPTVGWSAVLSGLMRANVAMPAEVIVCNQTITCNQTINCNQLIVVPALLMATTRG